ncbi:uncharacterized protein PV06_10885 [Exophiala oligosperma]|uniref:Major facilitator superfamily (MFS) profile domain-containing protein n=1 Tax=Exophiala oligosperma TaxID=215243 RepID=A0A0D2BHW1_9EURO|nr:uncharacterized protein PV06_10885 [Exophiala oligosperma]KIW36987.1 hypothetical protein PV06_10885 [Exophiala oligosperma]
MFEAGFLPSVVVYLSTFYTRNELASRIGIFYAASVIAFAFGGLLAYGLFHIHNAGHYSWSFLFFTEGSLTILCGIFLALVIPRTLQSARWLGQDENAAAESRLLKLWTDKINPAFSWSEAFLKLKTFYIYIRSLISISFGVLLASNANFLAIITVRLGYSTVKTNLYTVAPDRFPSFLESDEA